MSIEIPECLNNDAIDRGNQHVSRRHGVHVLKAGSVSIAVTIDNEIGERVLVGADGHGRVRRKGFDFGREQQRPRQRAVVQRAGAHSIAREHEPPFGRIEQRDGKIPVEVTRELFAVSLVRRHHQRGVGAHLLPHLPIEEHTATICWRLSRRPSNATAIPEGETSG